MERQIKISNDVIMCRSAQIEEANNSDDSSSDESDKTILEEIQGLRKMVTMIHNTDAKTKKTQKTYRPAEEVDGNPKVPTENANYSPRILIFDHEDDIHS